MDGFTCVLFHFLFVGVSYGDMTNKVIEDLKALVSKSSDVKGLATLEKECRSAEVMGPAGLQLAEGG